MGAGGGQVVTPAGLGRRDPQDLAGGIGHDLHVHAVATVLVRVVGPAIAHSVALCERPVEQNVLRVGLAEDLQQARRPGGQEVDDRGGVAMGGADRYTEAGRDLG